MSEELKTVSYLGIALVVAIGAFAISREAPQMTAGDLVGQAFVEIENPLEVKRLKIVKFDSASGEQDPFEVAKVGELYSIPSHENYPADARDHLVDAVTIVNDTEILASVSDRSGAHAEFGVVDPSDESLRPGAEGVGTRVTMTGNDSSPLADFIIGKKVADTDQQYYVRYADKDQVYAVEIDPDKLSTRFEDWIERDLLQIDPLELTAVDIEDYSLQTEQRLEVVAGGPRVVLAIGKDAKADMELDYQHSDLEWQLKKLTLFEQGKPKEIALADDEELNKDKLSDLKSALDDLEIVDVRRKVSGLQGDLLDFVKKNPKALSNLQSHGFYLAPKPDKNGYELLSNNGQIVVGMNDGVQYLLRFGGVAGAEKEAEQESETDAESKADNDAQDAETDGKKNDDAATDDANDSGGDDSADPPAAGDDAPGADADNAQKGTKVLRYLFVMTQLNEDLIEKPDFEEVPPEEPPAEISAEDGGEAAAEAGSQEKGGPESGEEESGGSEVFKELQRQLKDQTKSGGDEGAGNAEAAPPGEEAGEEPGEEGGNPPVEEKREEEEEEEEAEDQDETVGADDAGPAADDAATADQETGDTPADDGDVPEAPGDDDAASPPAGEADPADAAKRLEEWKEKRQKIIDENERKQKEYEGKREAAADRVAELNERFSDWYYVISDETYHKIHLGYTDVIKKKEKPEEEDTPADGDTDTPPDSLEQFDQLKEGLPES